MSCIILYIEIDWIWIGYWIYIFCVDISYVHMSNNQCFYCNSNNLLFPKSLCTSLYFHQFGLWCWLDLLDVSSCFRIISWHGSVGSHDIHLQEWVKVLILIIPKKKRHSVTALCQRQAIGADCIDESEVLTVADEGGSMRAKMEGLSSQLDFKIKTKYTYLDVIHDKYRCRLSDSCVHWNW